MTPENFTYWLNGYFEIAGKDSHLNTEQVKVIKDHLALVLKKVTPNTITITDLQPLHHPNQLNPWSPILTPGTVPPTTIC